MVVVCPSGILFKIIANGDTSTFHSSLFNIHSSFRLVWQKDIPIHVIPAIIANPTKWRNYFSFISVKKASQFRVYFLTILWYTTLYWRRDGLWPGPLTTARCAGHILKILQAFSEKMAIQGLTFRRRLLVCVVHLRT